MASMAAETCPYCLQVTNQGQNLYGPICNNGHRAHLNCIMNQFDSNDTFNIDTWTCPMCRGPAYYSPDSGIPSLNQVLRQRFPRRIANLEEEEYSSEEDTDMEEEPDDSQSEELTIEDRLIQQYPFLGVEYRENEGEYRESIMNQLTQHVTMHGVFPLSAQFQSTVDAGQMGAILIEQWYRMWNMTSSYEGEGDMEEVHSSMTNQSEFFRALTRTILAGDRRRFWRITPEQRLDLQVAINFGGDPRSNAMASLHGRGGKRKKKTRRKRGGMKRKRTKRRRAGTKRKRDGPPTPRRPPRRRLNPPPQQQQQQGQLDIDNDDYDDYEALMEDIAANVDPDDPNFIQGGRRKKRGGMEEPSTPPRPPKDNDRGTNRYPPGFTLPPPQVPVRIAGQPQQARMMRMRGRRERLRDRHPGAIAPTQRMINEYNEQLRRSQNSRVRNVAGDVLEACTGSRCGLGGRRKKKRRKTRRKKNRKRRTKKKSRRKKR